MEIRQGITLESWEWLQEAIQMKMNYDVDNIPQEVVELYAVMTLLKTVSSACPAIKLTLREKENENGL